MGVDVLETVDQWLEPWRIKIWESMYRRDENEARSLLERSFRALENAGISDAGRQACQLSLQFMEFQVDESFELDIEHRDRLIVAALEELGQAQDLPVLIACRARILLTLRCWAARFGLVPLDEAEVDTMMSAVNQDELDHQAWTYLAFWAFALRNSRYLNLAYRQFLVRPFDFMLDFTRQRMRVMLRIVDSDVERSDIERLIKLIPHHFHLNWMRDSIIPALVDLGVWDPELNALLLVREQEIISAGPVPPPRLKEPPSFRINI